MPRNLHVARDMDRTSPYVKAWNRDYAELGLVVVGAQSTKSTVRQASWSSLTRAF